MLVADCGSTWSKVFETEKGHLEVLETKHLLQDPSTHFDWATGHMAKNRCQRYENELIALASGALEMINEPDFTVLDIGSRDTKFVTFKERRLVRMDWNQACGASTGFTLELLGNYYAVDYQKLEDSKEVPVTCGVFAMEKVFDAILHGATPTEALSGMVRGIARNAHSFAGNPEKLYLSGGLCENPAFLTALEGYCAVHPLGRGVLLQGLLALLKQ